MSPKKFILMSWMLACDGLNRGSLMSARNFCLSLISPSHSVFTNRLETSASSAAESRFTCASFQRRSRTMSLLSRGSACWAASPMEPSNKIKQQETVRIIRAYTLVGPNKRRTLSQRYPSLLQMCHGNALWGVTNVMKTRPRTSALGPQQKLNRNSNFDVQDWSL